MGQLTVHRGPAGGVQLAGQLGGTAASPDVRGLRETSGPTLLTLGAVADGELLARSGPNVVGAAAGQWKRLATATASSSATIDFTLPAGYVAYQLVLNNVAPATDNVVPWLRTSSNGGSSFDSGASDYCWAAWVWATAATTSATGDAADSEIQLTGNSTIGNASNEHLSGIITVLLPSAAQYCTVMSQLRGTNLTPQTYGASSIGQRETAADVDAIRFLFSSGNIASGTFDLYGLAT